MVILVNGSFGVGKTTVARLLVERVPGSTLFNPEVIGFVLQRLPDFVALSGRDTEDFQDIPLWRRLTVLTALLSHKIIGRTVIIPMAFCKSEYLDQIRTRLSRSEVPVRHFCLVAPVEVIYERLGKRGVKSSSAESQSVYSRAAGCCRAYAAPEFGEHINTNKRTPGEVADDILERINAA